MSGAAWPPPDESTTDSAVAVPGRVVPSFEVPFFRLYHAPPTATQEDLDEDPAGVPHPGPRVARVCPAAVPAAAVHFSTSVPYVTNWRHDRALEGRNTIDP